MRGHDGCGAGGPYLSAARRLAALSEREARHIIESLVTTAEEAERIAAAFGEDASRLQYGASRRGSELRSLQISDRFLFFSVDLLPIS